jgi:hypothetical protein
VSAATVSRVAITGTSVRLVVVVVAVFVVVERVRLPW